MEYLSVQMIIGRWTNEWKSKSHHAACFAGSKGATLRRAWPTTSESLVVAQDSKYWMLLGLAYG